MSDEQMMIERLLVLAQELDGRPPYEEATMTLSAGEVSMLAKGIELLAAVRLAAKA
jgi:hypothetical protein